MAHTIAPFYAIDASVGKLATNNTQDVMLVQFFLFSILIDPSWPTPWGPWVPQGIGPEAIYPADGVYRPALVDWIRTFQEYANMNGQGPLIVDGVVSYGGRGWGDRATTTRRWHAIHAMNHILFLTNKARFCDLPNDGSLPGGLKGALGLAWSF